MRKPRIYASSVEDIGAGRVTDIYFVRTRDVLSSKGFLDRRVTADVHTYSLPSGYRWAVFAGLEEAVALLEGKRVDVYSMREGEVFRSLEPVLEVSGPYGEFGVYESSILGLLRHSSSVATKAARIRLKAWEKTLIFFGIRCVHPAVAPAVDRAAYIGGCDAVSGVLGAEMIGERPLGTMPHALIIVSGGQAEAWRAFDAAVPEDVPRIALCDTFQDEREEALLAARTLGERLYGVRLDTPSSRRGNMRMIVEEVRWTLAVNGYGDVKLYVSGGIDEDEAEELLDLVDGFGVGTSIAFPPSIDLALDIVEVEGKPVSKRGKLPASKQVYRCEAFHDTVVPRWRRLERCPKCGGEVEELLRPLIVDGEIVGELPKPREIRSYLLSRLEKIRELGELDPRPLLLPHG
ncbi:MAG: nicotinate phosphoribosyltransferase [Nitrososphaerota archaeon]|nr:nicotinate phosphoribosyltransferase [Candidatus Calditenuaceae archaeon]MDW8073352.1 nicotinate phosphoribosyltransferase [Nitrososphaerota archaeon]